MEHSQMKQAVQVKGAELRRLESEQLVLANRVQAFERKLALQQEHMDLQEQQSIQDAEELRQRCNEFRQILQKEQRESFVIDQRVVLRPQAGAEVAGVVRESAALLDTVPR